MEKGNGSMAHREHRHRRTRPLPTPSEQPGLRLPGTRFDRLVGALDHGWRAPRDGHNDDDNDLWNGALEREFG
jgi:hypothetical protein